VPIIGADFLPPDQPQDRQPVAPAARRRGEREPVDGYDKGRGYEIGKGQYLLIEEEELEAIEIASTHTIGIDSFVPAGARRFRCVSVPGRSGIAIAEIKAGAPFGMDGDARGQTGHGSGYNVALRASAQTCSASVSRS
jgi:hypothetical protein